MGRVIHWSESIFAGGQSEAHRLPGKILLHKIIVSYGRVQILCSGDYIIGEFAAGGDQPREYTLGIQLNEEALGAKWVADRVESEMPFAFTLIYECLPDR